MVFTLYSTFTFFFFFGSYSTYVFISDLKGTVTPLRAFSLGIQFRCLENSLAILDMQKRKEGYLVFLAIRNPLERNNFFLPLAT